MTTQVEPFQYRQGVPLAPLGVPRAVVLHARVYAGSLLAIRKLAPWLAVVALVAVACVAMGRLADADPLTVQTVLSQLVLRATGLTALGLAVSAIREDVDAGAMPLLLLRPRATEALPIGRWLAVTAVVVLLGLLMTGAMVAALWGKPAALSGAAAGAHVLAVAASGAAYCGLFLAIGAWFKSATGAALGWFVGVDLVVARFSSAAASLSPATYAARLVEQLSAGPGLSAAKDSTVATAPWAMVGTMLILAAVGCALAVWRLRRDIPQ